MRFVIVLGTPSSATLPSLTFAFFIIRTHDASSAISMV